MTTTRPTVLLVSHRHGPPQAAAVERWWRERLDCPVRSIVVGTKVRLGSQATDVAVLVLSGPVPHKATLNLVAELRHDVPVIEGWRKSAALPVVRTMIEGAIRQIR